MQGLRFSNVGAHGFTSSDLHSSDLTSQDLNAEDRAQIHEMAKRARQMERGGAIEIDRRKKCCCIRESLKKVFTRVFLEVLNKQRKLETSRRLNMLENLQENYQFKSPTQENSEKSSVSSRNTSMRSGARMQEVRQQRRDSVLCREVRLMDSKEFSSLATLSNRNPQRNPQRNPRIEEFDGYIASSESV